MKLRPYVVEPSNPLGNQIARASYQRARLQRLKFIATKAQREITITKEVYAAVDALASAWAKLIAAGIEVDAAERSFKAEDELFDLGDRTSTDVSVAIFRLGHARENRIQAEVEYEIALSRLAHATGSFLGYAGVQWSSETVDTIIPTDNQKQVMPPPGIDESELIEGEEDEAIKKLRKSMEEPVRPSLPPEGIEIGKDRKDPPSLDAPDTPSGDPVTPPTPPASPADTHSSPPATGTGSP